MRFELTTISRDNNIEWDFNVNRFQDFCQINLQLAKTTYSKYGSDIKRFFRFIKRKRSSNVHELIREYLKSVPNNGNSLRALKAYFKFLGREDVVKSYKFPRWPRRIKYISKEDVQIFCYALRDVREKALYLFYATTGLRKNEILSLRKDDINRRLRMVIPKNHAFSRTKHSWITFYNDEAEDLLNEYLRSRNDNSPKLFPISQALFCRMWREARDITEIKLSPRDLRFWFCSEMGRLGVPDRYIDTFCGRIPQRVIARHYTDYSPETLKEIYDKANLKVLA